LELLEKVFVGVLGHLSALIGIEENVINVQRGSNKGLLVSTGNRCTSTSGRIQTTDSPQALADRSEVEVNLDLVVLESNQRKSKSRVSAEPELKWDVKGGLRESVSGSANLSGSTRSSARSTDGSKIRVSDVGELGGVSNHLVVSTLLLSRESDLVPDVHPVSVLTVDALSSNLNLNLGNKVLTDVIHPSGINLPARRLSNLREGDLEVSAVGKISISGDGAGNTTSEIGLS
jgi:hypothetical protein